MARSLVPAPSDGGTIYGGCSGYGSALDTGAKGGKPALELVRRAEAGDEIVLTRDGKPSVRLVPVEPPALTEEQIAARRKLMEDIWETAKTKALAGPTRRP